MSRPSVLVLSAVFTLGAALGTVPLAYAGGGSCGGSSSSGSSGGSSSGGSSGGGSSSGSGSGSSEPAEPTCVDASPVVGLAECRGFGTGWDATGRPRSIIELEMGALMLDGRSLELPGVAVHEENRLAYSVDGIGRRTLPRIGFRFSRFVTRHLYLGGGLAFAQMPMSELRRDGELEVELTSVLSTQLVGAVGVAVGVGPVSLRAEVEGGARYLSIGLTTRHYECVVEDSLVQWRGVLSARAGLDFFLFSRASMGVFAGYDVLNGDLSVSTRLSFHRRAYDGLAAD